MRDHFSLVAPSYNKVRTTSSIHVSTIARRIKPRDEGIIRLAEVGIGPARYTVPLIKELGRKFPGHSIDIACIDSCKEMLDEARKNLSGVCGLNARFILGRGKELSALCSGDLDAVLIFNAIHHLDVDGFLCSCSESLREGGRLFIHTRTPLQNHCTVWGVNFPGFSEREKRLLTKKEMNEKVASTAGLELRSQAIYVIMKESPIEELVDKARKKHYSTLEYYGENEFESALEQFVENLHGKNGGDSVFHTIANILYVIEKKFRQ